LRWFLTPAQRGCADWPLKALRQGRRTPPWPRTRPRSAPDLQENHPPVIVYVNQTSVNGICCPDWPPPPPVCCSLSGRPLRPVTALSSGRAALQRRRQAAYRSHHGGRRGHAPSAAARGPSAAATALRAVGRIDDGDDGDYWPPTARRCSSRSRAAGNGGRCRPQRFATGSCSRR